MTTLEQLRAAKAAAPAMAVLTSENKNRAMLAMADALETAQDAILSANAADVEAARGTISEVMLDRLMLDPGRVTAMADGIRSVAALPDPCGRILETRERPNGLILQRVSVPMGVIAIIYESRPNVTSDAAALAVKAGSACVLRSGREAHRSASAIVTAMRAALAACGVSPDALQLIEDTSRASAGEIIAARGLVDLLIPRGGRGLIRACVDGARVPVLETGTGICHVYVEKTADFEMALRILENAKCSRPSVCNACEVCLVDADIAPDFLPVLCQRLTSDRAAAGRPAVQLRLDAAAAQIIPGTPAGPEDFDTEFLDYILAVHVVHGVGEAAAHIAAHSTGHSEAIVTRDDAAAAYFTSAVDSAAVYVNASTRFTDGGEFGLGCEMGISTQKLHARGPLGLQELCSYKYIIRGSGQIR